MHINHDSLPVHGVPAILEHRVLFQAPSCLGICKAKIYIPSTIKSVLMLWHKNSFRVLYPILTPKSIFWSQNLQFSNFYVNFYCGDSNFVIVLLMKPPPKIGYFSKTAEIFSSTLTAHLLKTKKVQDLFDFYGTWDV